MSISRVMTSISDEMHIKRLQRFKQLLAAYYKNRDLINIGAYVKGSNPEIDLSLAYFPKLQAFIQQSLSESVDYNDSLQQLTTLLDAAMTPASSSP